MDLASGETEGPGRWGRSEGSEGRGRKGSVLSLGEECVVGGRGGGGVVFCQGTGWGTLNQRLQWESGWNPEEARVWC